MLQFFKKIIKSRHIKIISICLLALVFVTIVRAVGTWQTGFKAIKDSVTTVDLTSGAPSNECKKVKNNTTDKDYFIPTKTKREWDAFKDAVDTRLAPNLTLSACDPVFPCGTALLYRGKSYDTVEIGTQCWFAKNMDYDNGCGSVTWANDRDQGWCGYYNGIDYGEGLLYQWSVAQNICPSGWHLPTDNELWTLEDYLSSGSCDASRIGHDCDLAGDKLKIVSKCSGTNNCGTSGFKALLAGYRHINGSYQLREAGTGYWSSTPSGSNVWDRALGSRFSSVHRYARGKAFGFPVRCLED